MKGLLFLALIIGCEKETPMQQLVGTCEDPNAYNCEINGDYHTWCDSTTSLVDSLIIHSLIEGNVSKCEYCIDVYSAEQCYK